MENHYTYIGEIIHNPDGQKFFTALALGIGIILLGFLSSRTFSTKEKLNDSIIPPKGFSLLGIFDFFVESFVNYHDSILGKENRKYVSFSGSVFLFILLANLIGLIPGMAAITTTVWVNVGLALAVFIYFNYLGIKEQGLKGYLGHFCAPSSLVGETPKQATFKKWLGWGGFALIWILLTLLLFPIEILSTCLRVLTLNLRLYWNIAADHMVLNVFTNEIGPLVPIIKSVSAFPIYILGIFVSFMQAFIFTTLTMVYVLLAVQHGDH